MTNQTNETRIRRLSSIIDSQFEYMNYSMARYTADPSFDIRQSNDITYQMWFSTAIENNITTSTNVIKSVIDTIVSKVSNQKVRPYFNTVKSNYETKQVVREAQRYFDILFDQQKVHNKVVHAFRDACIFGVGYIFIDIYDDYNIKVLPPWTVGIQNSQKGYGEPVDMLIKMNNYPTELLEDKKDHYGQEFVQKCIYISSKNNGQGKWIELVNNAEVSNKKYEYDTLPLISIYYNKPIFGTRTTSLVQDLDSIQTQIDLINNKISTASLLTPAQTVYVMEGTNIDPNAVNNRTGNIYPIKMPPGVSQLPVVIDHPTPFDPMWQSMLDYYINKAYDIAGVSQLSAMSKKPAGLDSGVAIQSMEDIESDRFQVQLDSFIHMFVDIVITFMNVVPDNKSIIEEEGYDWSKIKNASKQFQVQYSASSALSKDPSEKLKQVMQLSQVGLIGPEKIGEYLDTPDIEALYSEARSMYAAASKVVSNAIDGNIDIPMYVSWKEVAKRLAVTQNELYASMGDSERGNDKILEQLNNLQKLEDTLNSLIEQYGVDDQAEASGQISENGIGAVEDVTAAPSIVDGQPQPDENMTDINNELDPATDMNNEIEAPTL